MKIAIPSNDNVNVSRHFGKSKGFAICEIENGKIINRQHISNTITGHAQGLHVDKEHHQHIGGHEHHSHEGILKAIGDCQVVIAGGMGRRLYDDFANNNIQVFITNESTVDTALDAFINNSLDNNPEKCCNH